MTNVTPLEPVAADEPAGKSYRATIYPVDEAVDAEFAATIVALEKALDMKIWVLAQCPKRDGEWNEISETVYQAFRNAKEQIEPKSRAGLLIHSPGGQASCAYKIVRLFQRRTDEFYTVVPLYAKSAATLMAVGGKEIIMGNEAELGPLDVQLYDRDKDDWDSALNAAQSLERLNAYALTAFDQAMQLFLARTRKKPDALMPLSLEYAISIVKPLVEKIDTIELTRKSRELKVAEDYAVRLMKANYARTDYLRIASNLVERFSSHDFVIDRTEAGVEGGSSGNPLNLGLHLMHPSEEVESLFTKLGPFLEQETIIGRVVEVGS